MSQQFKREDRYIVIKRSDFERLRGGQTEGLRQQLAKVSPLLPNREFLVIESDWPEYAPTWAAIERRVTGQPSLVDSREQFEQAYSEDNGGVPVAFLMSCRQGDSYTVPKVARAWYWWKRARAGAVVVAVLPEKLADAYEWGYGDGQNSPNGYSSKEDRDKCVADLMQSIEAAGVKVAT